MPDRLIQTGNVFCVVFALILTALLFRQTITNARFPLFQRKCSGKTSTKNTASYLVFMAIASYTYELTHSLSTRQPLYMATTQSIYAIKKCFSMCSPCQILLNFG